MNRVQALDHLDRRIIGTLRGDGPAPIAEIAHVPGVSRATVRTVSTASCATRGRSTA